MIKTNLISVIIPVYNVRLFLEKCVLSIISQTYENIEMILVNDGSTDGSGELCEKLAKQDHRIAVIHQENVGLSDARNIGTKTAKGQFVFYVDSDDYISSDCLQKLLDAILKHNAEIVQANFYYDYPDCLLYDNALKGNDKVFSREDAMRHLLKQETIKNFAWGKLIRADIAKQSLFPKGKYFEDTFWKHLIIDKCTKYVVLAKPLVYYHQRAESISGTFSFRNLDQLDGEIELYDFIKKYYPNLVPLAKSSLRKKLLLHHSHIQHLNKKNQSLYLSEIIKIEDKYVIEHRNSLDEIKQVFSRIFQRFLNRSQYVKTFK